MAPHSRVSFVAAMRLLDELLDQAVSVIPAHLHARLVVFGSAPMVFAGLKPDVSFDLDLFTDGGTYGALRGAGFVQDEDERGLPRILVTEAVEVVSEWPGVTFEEVFAASAPRDGSRGLRVAALEHVLAFKAISGREKDLREAEILRRELRGTARRSIASLLGAARPAALTRAGDVWNRAALERGGGEPREGDVALAALLRAHGLVMNGGVLHAAEYLEENGLRAACDGYRFFQYDGLAKLLAESAAAIAKGRVSDSQEGDATRTYARSIPDDSALISRFERHFAEHPELYAPVTARPTPRPR
jgi:hypothetical protein